jgi:Protein of unknown function (DUF3019)
MGLASVLCSGVLLLPSQTNAATGDGSGNIHLELSPRICTLTTNDTQCDAVVHARWRAPGDESLCLVIVGRPEIKRCWEHYSEGNYSIELIFSADLIFQLKDLDQQRVLTSEALRVIHEAIRYRHKRREPWNIFD